MVDVETIAIDKLSSVAAALIGGLITGIFSLRATNRAIRRENEKEKRLDEKEVQNLLDALGVEISTLWAFHMRRIGGIVEALPDGAPLEFYYPLTQDYFTIYSSNAAKIGSVKDAELREAIVVCYNKCKKVVDGFKYNNELFRDYRDFINLSDESPSDHLRIESKRKELVEYARIVKEDHYELKQYIEKFLQLLKRSANASEPLKP